MSASYFMQHLNYHEVFKRSSGQRYPRLIFLKSSEIQPACKPTSCINIAERDLQMQDRSAFEPNNNVSFKVHRELTPDCNIFRHARNF